MLEDRILLLQLKRGLPAARRRVYEKYAPMLLKLAVSLLGNIHLAEDVTQQVFVKLFQLGDGLRVTGNLRSLLCTMTVNLARNAQRDHSRRSGVSIDESSLSATHRTPLGWAILNEQLVSLVNALKKLPDEQREVVVLKLYDQMTFREIAKIQEVSSNTVQGRYRYGMEKLRSLLGTEEEES